MLAPTGSVSADNCEDHERYRIPGRERRKFRRMEEVLR
jgi:hypothetical protein